MKSLSSKMSGLFALCVMALWSSLSFGMSPYFKGDNLPAADVAVVMGSVESKLQSAGFTVIGKYQPTGIPGHGVVVVTDKGILDAIRAVGGDAIAGAGIRVGVKADGSVSYMNPEYWYRAYFRDNYSKAEAAAKAVETKLGQALGKGQQFGGEVDTGKLAKYNYMFGMEDFDDNRELKKHESFEKAVEAVRASLAKNDGGTAKVYEVVMADKKIAVFGVAMNDPKTGEGAWVNKIEGTENIAALPYEVFVVGDQVEAFFARYRIALAWSALKMTSFAKIMSTPANIKKTLQKVSGEE